MKLRGSAAGLALLMAAGLLAGCGGSPGGPGPIIQPPPGNTPPPPANALPVIEALNAQGRRPKEPAQFADLAETIDVSARVRDEETDAADLEYQWTAPAGTFQGSGARVAWRAPDTLETPADIPLTLKVTERFGYPGGPKSYSQEVSSTVLVSVHDSPKEIGQMARQFLLEFSDSRIRDVGLIMRNFIPGCYGTKDETDQVAENRRRYVILDYSVGEAQTTVNFGGVCPYLAKKGDACTSVPVYWKSLDMDRNTTGAVTGKDWIASFYQPDKRRWGLCDSSFEGRVAAAMRDFVR